MNDYISHWKYNLNKLFNGYDRCGIFTTMYIPSQINFNELWCFYCKGQDVYIVNVMLFKDEFRKFSYCIDNYLNKNDININEDCSIWVVSKESIRAYLNKDCVYAEQIEYYLSSNQLLK